MKKLFYLAIALLIFSCTTEDLIENQEAVDVIDINKKNLNPVSLVKSWTTFGTYRGFSSYTRKFTVQVADLAFDKSVSIFHEKLDGSWEEIPLSYSFDIDEDQEIWIGNQTTSSQVYADEFVVKYEVDGKVYWDNNNGANYKMSVRDGYFLANPDSNISVDTDFDSIFYSSFYDQNQLNVTVDVRNLSPTKEVVVVYTTDGWQTQSEFSLSYRPFWNSGPFISVTSPNQFGIERWSGFVRFDSTINTVEYAVLYRVNGQEYWDNNYGKNHVVIRRVNG